MSGVVVCVGGLDSVAHVGLVVGIEADYCLGGSLEEEKVLMGLVSKVMLRVDLMLCYCSKGSEEVIRGRRR
jgi:hypothetical protein